MTGYKTVFDLHLVQGIIDPVFAGFELRIPSCKNYQNCLHTFQFFRENTSNIKWTLVHLPDKNSTQGWKIIEISYFQFSNVQDIKIQNGFNFSQLNICYYWNGR